MSFALAKYELISEHVVDGKTVPAQIVNCLAFGAREVDGKEVVSVIYGKEPSGAPVTLASDAALVEIRRDVPADQVSLVTESSPESAKSE
jgi:hypothetical protein